MFGKLLAISVALGLMSLTLLLERQRRYETTLEISRTYWRVLEQERSLWRLRSDVARRTHPEKIRVAMQRLDERWQPIPNRLDRPNAPTAPRLAAGSREGPQGGDADEAAPVRFGG